MRTRSWPGHKAKIRYTSQVLLQLVVDFLGAAVYPYRCQRAKKAASNSPGLVDFAIGLVIFVLNLPNGQVLFFAEIQITEGLQSILLFKKGFGAS